MYSTIIIVAHYVSSVLMVSLTTPEMNLCLQKNSLWKLHRHLSTVNALSMDAIHLEDHQLETRPF